MVELNLYENLKKVDTVFKKLSGNEKPHSNELKTAYNHGTDAEKQILDERHGVIVPNLRVTVEHLQKAGEDLAREMQKNNQNPHGNLKEDALEINRSIKGTPTTNLQKEALKYLGAVSNYDKLQQKLKKNGYHEADLIGKLQPIADELRKLGVSLGEQHGHAEDKHGQIPHKKPEQEHGHGQKHSK